MPELKGINAGEQLGHPQFFRAVFEPAALDRFLPATDRAFATGMATVFSDLASSPLVRAVSPNPTVPGQVTAVVDLATQPAAATRTVAELARELDRLSWRINLRSLQRITGNAATGPSAAEQRQREQTKTSSQVAATGLNGLAEGLGTTLSTLRILAILVAIALVFWSFSQARRAVS